MPTYRNDLDASLGELLGRVLRGMLVGTYVKERDNNRMKGVETGVVFWSKVLYLFRRGSKGDLRSLYVFSYIHIRQGFTLVIINNQYLFFFLFVIN